MVVSGGGAALFPAVDLLMLPQHSEHREALHADVALVRPLSGVRAHVLLQPRRSAKLSAADATGELLRPLVELPVLQQLLHRQEVLLTQEAVKIHLPLSFRQTENNLKLQLLAQTNSQQQLYIFTRRKTEPGSGRESRE